MLKDFVEQEQSHQLFFPDETNEIIKKMVADFAR
jgi:hypothetical protein